MDIKSAKSYIQDAIDKMHNAPFGATSQLNSRLAIEDLHKALNVIEIELAGKDAVIEALHEDIRYYRKALGERVN